MDKISVIVTVYNKEANIKRCIESIINQTYSDFELIIINDGSTDASYTILSQYKDKRIKIYNQENQGAGQARNNALEKVTGKYITFIDGDDYIENKFLEDSYNILKKYDADIVANSYAKNKSNKEITILDKIQALRYLIALPEKIPMSVTGKLWKKQLSKDILFDTQNHFEDIEFATRLFLNADKIIYYDSGYYNYIHDKESRSSFFSGNDRIKACLAGKNLIEKNYNILLNDYMTYTLFNAISIANMMILNNSYNSELLNEVKKIVKDNIKCVKKSQYSYLKKLQIYIFNFNFDIYKKIYHNLKKLNGGTEWTRFQLLYQYIIRKNIWMNVYNLY